MKIIVVIIHLLRLPRHTRLFYIFSLNFLHTMSGTWHTVLKTSLPLPFTKLVNQCQWTSNTIPSLRTQFSSKTHINHHRIRTHITCNIAREVRGFACCECEFLELYVLRIRVMIPEIVCKQLKKTLVKTKFSRPMLHANPPMKNWFTIDPHIVVCRVAVCKLEAKICQVM